MDTYLALDLGGTKLMIAELTRAGEILRSARYDSGYTTQTEAVAGIFAALDDYTAGGFVGVPTALGMGLTGKVDYKRGVWRSLSHIDQDMIPLAHMLTEKTGLPATIDNDMHAAANAELKLGCGNYCDDFIYLNVGTGLAAGLVSDRHVLHGYNNMCGEVGHTSTGVNYDVTCFCGKKGCAEQTVSGIGFDAQARRLSARYPDSRLTIPTHKKVSGREVFALAQEGDALCSYLLDEGVEALAVLITNMVRFIDPAVIVLGGGMAVNETLFVRVTEALKAYSVMDNVPYGLKHSSFSPDLMGIVGAAALAMPDDAPRR